MRFLDESTFVSADDKGVLRLWRRASDQACLPLLYVETSANDMPFSVEVIMREASARKINFGPCSTRDDARHRLFRLEGENLVH